MFQFPKITKLVKMIIIVNIVLWVLEVILLRTSMSYTILGLFLTPERVLNGEIWQLFTYGFFHSPTQIFHLILNMLILYFFSYDLNTKWGDKRFIIFYGLTILGGGIFVVLESFIIKSHYYVPTLGASAAIFAITTAYALTYAEQEIYFFLFPMKAKYLIHIDLGIILLSYLAIGDGQSSNAAHLGGMVTAYIILKVPWYRYRRRKDIKKYLKIVK